MSLACSIRRWSAPACSTLVADDAPTRAILCAGAGHFACANITMTDGMQLGADAGEKLIADWDAASDRNGEIVPAYGFVQAERELACAGLTGGAVAAVR